MKVSNKQFKKLRKVIRESERKLVADGSIPEMSTREYGLVTLGKRKKKILVLQLDKTVTVEEKEFDSQMIVRTDVFGTSYKKLKKKLKKSNRLGKIV